MKCTSPILARSTKGLTYHVRCKQCVACRIAKKDDWTLRCQLETLTATTSSFWTLTYAEENLPNSVTTIRRQVRNFFNILRRKEKRGGNPNMIRYFGCLEFGGKFGRPHVHLAIWNLHVHYREPQPYRKGLPKPPIHIDAWPHGHIDLGQLNTGSINYIAGYLTDFKNPDQPQPLTFSTRRPGIGFTGILSLVEQVAPRLPAQISTPTSITLKTRQYSFSPWTKGVLLYAFRKAGKEIILPKGYDDWKAKIEEMEMQEKLTPEWLKRRTKQRLKRYVETIEITFAAQEKAEQQASAIYSARAQQKSNS